MMTDERYTLYQDCREKKSIAASAHKQRTHCGKGGSVRFPHDNLTKKELRAMSGECVSYRMNEPMAWGEFKAMPNDLKVAYITSIRDRFGAPNKYIAEMMGVCQSTFGLYAKDLGLGVGKDGSLGKGNWAKEAFLAWSHGADPNAVNEATVEEPSENASVSPVEPVGAENKTGNEAACGGNSGSIDKVLATPECGNMTFECPADQALNMLKLVLQNKKVELSVNWRIVEESNDD